LQNMEKFNFTRTWRLTLDIRAVRGATVLMSGSCRSMLMHLCFKVIHLQCVCSKNYQQII
jgi:alkylated DNA repair dioxygenase AlkB